MKLVVLALALVACEARRDKGPIDREAAAKLFEQHAVPVPHGMSDLTIDDRGVLWAIPERERVIVELELDEPPRVHPLEGVPLGIDTEGLAWLGDGRFAIGFEGAFSQAAGVMLAERRDDTFAVTRIQPVLDRDLGVSLTINHGIEAVCGRDGELLLAAETVGKLPDGRRWAPLVRLRGDEVHVTRLWLTSSKGKISALHCKIADDGVAHVIAIERHFGVARLLELTVDRDDTDVTPAIELDLQPVLRDAYNLEGVTRLHDGRLVTINDNQGKTASGPTVLLVFHPR